MPRAFLLLVPAVLIGGTVAVVLARLFQVPPPPPGPAVAVDTAAAAGVLFEVEYRPGSEAYRFDRTDAAAVVTRGPDRLEFRFNTPVVNGTAFPPPPPGGTVRWNLDGPLLLDGRPAAPHRFQPWKLDAPPADLLWDIRNPSDAPRDSLTADWSKAGRVLVTAHGDGVARVWDADAGAVRHHLTPQPPEGGRKFWGLKAAVSPDGKTVATANVQAAAVTLWAADTGTRLATLGGPDGKLTDLRFAADGCLLEAHGGTLYARDLSGDRGTVRKVAAVHAGLPASFALAAGLRAAGDGRRVTLTRPPAPCAGATDPPAAAVEGVSEDAAFALSPDGRTLATADAGVLTLHDLPGGAARRLWWRTRPDGGVVPVGALLFFPDGRTLAAGSADGLRLYDVETGRERGWVPTLALRSLAVSGDGATLAATAEHGPAVLLWPLATLQPR